MTDQTPNVHLTRDGEHRVFRMRAALNAKRWVYIIDRSPATWIETEHIGSADTHDLDCELLLERLTVKRWRPRPDRQKLILVAGLPWSGKTP